MLAIVALAALIGTVLPTIVDRGDDPTRRERAGGHLTIVSSRSIDSIDPAAAYDTLSWSVMRGVYRTLVAYRSGPDGPQLVGDLAMGTGTVDASGTEWTFRLRDDIRYGLVTGGRSVTGVTGEAVTGADVVRAFEALTDPSTETPYSFYYDDIVEVVARDDATVVFELDQPLGDFPHRLTLPAAAPLPERPDTGDAPATGPYAIASQSSNRIELMRNPEWSAGSDPLRAAFVDEVTWLLGQDLEAATQGVLEGAADVGTDLLPAGPRLALMASSAQGRRFLARYPEPCTDYVYLNTTVPPFDDVRVRAAVNLALDRAYLKRIIGGEVTGPVATGIVPPGIPGHLPRDEFDPFKSPGSAGDMERARRMLAGAGFPRGYHRPITLVVSPTVYFELMAEALRGDLNRLGFSSVEVTRPEDESEYERLQRAAHVGTLGGWCADFNEPASFFEPLFTSAGGELNRARLDDPQLDRAIEAARSAMGTERVAAWEQVNRLATRSGALIPWSWSAGVTMIGPHVDAPYDAVTGYVDWVNARLSDQAEVTLSVARA